MIQHLQVCGEGLVSNHPEDSLEHLEEEIRARVAVPVIDEILEPGNELQGVLVIFPVR